MPPQYMSAFNVLQSMQSCEIRYLKILTVVMVLGAIKHHVRCDVPRPMRTFG